MQRRDVLKTWAAAGLTTALSQVAESADGAAGNLDRAKEMDRGLAVHRLPPPEKGRRIAVAFLLSPGAEVVDFAGPWGVFEYVDVPGRDDLPFQLYTVAESAAPLKVSGGLAIVPDYTFANAPQPNVIVVPALGDDPTPAMLLWLQQASRNTDLTMSVCNGAFVLAKAGLLDGKEAVAHHGSLTLFAADFPSVKVRRGARFVDAGAVSTAGGLTSGIDLALHVVERYYGRDIAESTATSLEYQGLGWKNPQSNAAFAARPRITGEPPRCPVCEAELLKEKASYRKEVYRGKTYYFCSQDCNDRFDKTPDRFMEM